MTETRRLRSSALACLAVGDLEAAVAYYEERLGFRESVRFDDGGPVLVVRGSARLLLAEDARSPAADHWTAVVWVPDVDALAAEFSRAGAEIVAGVGPSAIGERSLLVRDPWDNHLCFATLAQGSTVSGALRRLEPRRSVSARRQRRSDLEERPHRERFRDFYRQLPRRHGAIFAFFTSGLLHWVAKAESLVPADVNLVLIGADLTAEEQAWVRERLGRPFHHIDLPVDDKTVWQFLFECCDEDFGWLDIDCLVLEPKLFDEIAALRPGEAMRGAWSFAAPGGATLLSSCFLFLAAEPLARVQRDTGVSALPYDWVGAPRGTRGRACYSLIPTRRQRRLLLEVFSPDANGRPQAPQGCGFDTLIAFQAFALLAGFKLEAIRPLRVRYGHDPVTATDDTLWPQDASDELLHVGGISYWTRRLHDHGWRTLYLSADYAMLDPIVDELPEAYAIAHARISRELGRAAEDVDAHALLHAHLVQYRGMSEAAARRALAPGLPSQTFTSAIPGANRGPS